MECIATRVYQMDRWALRMLCRWMQMPAFSRFDELETYCSWILAAHNMTICSVLLVCHRLLPASLRLAKDTHTHKKRKENENKMRVVLIWCNILWEKFVVSCTHGTHWYLLGIYYRIPSCMPATVEWVRIAMPCHAYATMTNKRTNEWT